MTDSPAFAEQSLFKGRVRDRVNPREFQWALGGEQLVADVTLRRYMRGQLPYPAGDAKHLGSAGAWPSTAGLHPSPEPAEDLDSHRQARPDAPQLPRRRAAWVSLQTVEEDEIFAAEAQAV